MTIGEFGVLGAAVAGAAVATFLSVPAGALLGAIVGSMLAVAAKLNGDVPALFRNLGFTVIGVSLGASLTPGFLADVARWPISLGLMCIVLALVMAVGSMILVRMAGYSPRTAILATSPGALSFVVGVAGEDGYALRTITILQSLRLLSIALFLPPVVDAIDVGGAASGAYIMQDLRGSAGYMAGCALVGLTFAMGFFAERLGLPVAFLLAGVAVSGTAHASGAVRGGLPEPMTFLGFVIAGAVVGSRFRNIARAEFVRLGWAAFAISVTGITLTAIAAFFAAGFLGLPFGLVWMSYAPGGVEAMAAMGAVAWI